MQKIKFLLFGAIDRDLTGRIAEGVEEVYETPVEIVDEKLDLPEWGYDHTRGQYLANMFIRSIPTSEPDVKTLGITDEDLYAPELNFVFGQAQLPGDRAVMSVARLRPEYWDEDPDRDLLIDRAVKETVHELGHTLGLRHCDDPDCVMHFSNRLTDTDRKQRRLCEECLRELTADA